jgi:hypothetical protein
MQRLLVRVDMKVQRRLGHIDPDKFLYDSRVHFNRRVHFHFPSLQNAGSQAQVTVRAKVKNRPDALGSPTGLFQRNCPKGKTNYPTGQQRKSKRSVELWTIRLRRSGRLAVENAARFPPRRPLPTAATDHPFIYIQKFKNRTYKGKERGEKPPEFP